jgi:hypothetical protein
VLAKSGGRSSRVSRSPPDRIRRSSRRRSTRPRRPKPGGLVARLRRAADGLACARSASLVRGGIATTERDGFRGARSGLRARPRDEPPPRQGNEAVRRASSPRRCRSGASPRARPSRIQRRPRAASSATSSIQLDFAEDKQEGRRPRLRRAQRREEGRPRRVPREVAGAPERRPVRRGARRRGGREAREPRAAGPPELQAVRVEVDRAKFFARRPRPPLQGARARRRREVQGQRGRRRGAADRRRRSTRTSSGSRPTSRASERARLEGILAALEATKTHGLAAEVRAHLEKMPKRPSPREAPEASGDRDR